MSLTKTTIRQNRRHFPKGSPRPSGYPRNAKQLVDTAIAEIGEERAFDYGGLGSTAALPKLPENCFRNFHTRKGWCRGACHNLLTCPECARSYMADCLERMMLLYERAGPIARRIVPEEEAEERIGDIDNPSMLVWFRLVGGRRAIFFPHPSGREGKAWIRDTIETLLQVDPMMDEERPEREESYLPNRVSGRPDDPTENERATKAAAAVGYGVIQKGKNWYRFTKDGAECAMDDDAWRTYLEIMFPPPDDG